MPEATSSMRKQQFCPVEVGLEVEKEGVGHKNRWKETHETGSKEDGEMGNQHIEAGIIKIHIGTTGQQQMLAGTSLLRDDLFFMTDMSLCINTILYF